MAQKTSGELEREFIDGLKEETGRDLSGWLDEIRACGIQKRNELVNRLKTENGFGHMHASLLAGIYLNGGKPVYGDTSELLENQLAKAEQMRPLYNAFVEFVRSAFPECIVLPKKTYVSILEKREFAAINIKPKELRIGLDLGDRPFDETVTKAKLTGPMPRISHQLVITDEGRFDDGLIALLKASHGRSH